MNISIIVVTRNRAPLLAVCLKKLLRQVQPHDEVIVVDNASTDTTAAVVRSFTEKFPIRYLYESRLGASYGRNAGFKAARGQGIAFIDDDSLVDASWLREIRTTLVTRARRYPNTVYQGKITQWYRHQSVYELLRLRDFRYDLCHVGMHDEAKQFSQLRSLIAANIFSYRRVFERVAGPFNAGQFPFIGEDPDLAYRLIQRGVQIVYAPHAGVVHTKNTPVTLLDSARAAYRYGRATALFEKLYFANEQFLFTYYARSVDEGGFPKRHDALDAIIQRHPWAWVQSRIFYTVTSIAHAVGHALYKTFLLSA